MTEDAGYKRLTLIDNAISALVTLRAALESAGIPVEILESVNSKAYSALRVVTEDSRNLQREIRFMQEKQRKEQKR